MPASKVIVVVEAFRKAFELAKELEVNVKVQPPALPTPRGPITVDLSRVSFEEVGQSLKPVRNRETSLA